jgi:hypothetical protein
MTWMEATAHARTAHPAEPGGRTGRRRADAHGNGSA